MTKPHDCYFGCGFSVKRAVDACSRADCGLKEIAQLLVFHENQRDNERYHATEGFTGDRAPKRC